MVAAALADGTADRDCVFEVFARRLPHGRRYGVLAGTGRLLEALAALPLRGRRAGGAARAGHHRRAAAGLAGRLPVHRRHRRLRRGRPLLPRLAGAHRPGARSPRACCWRPSPCRSSTTTARSPRPPPAWSPPPASGPCIEMGSRRTHEEAAVAAARAAYLVGFASTLQPRGRPALRRPDHRHQRARVHAAARRREGRVPGAGRHPRPRDDAARRHLRRRPGHPDRGRGRRPRARRHPAGLRRPARRWPPTPASCWTPSGATKTRIVVTSDLDEYAISGLMAAPVDRYGVGTSLVTGSGAPTVGMVYKLVERDGVPVAKKSEGKRSVGGRKHAVRRHDADGTALAEVVSSRADRRRATATGTSSSRWSAAASRCTRRRPRPRRCRRRGRTTSGCGRRCRRRRGRCRAASRCWRR